MTDAAKPLDPVEWDDFSELHEKDDGGGILSGFKSLHQGTLTELIRFVMHLPVEDRAKYVIAKSGDHRLDWNEIAELAARPDFPG